MAQKSAESDSITIGRLSALAHVDAGTVRFYERSGLLQAQKRTRSGYRLYSRNSLARVQFICRARETGYSLEQIRQILRLHDQGGSRAEVKEFTANMIDDIEEKIRALDKWRLLFTDISDYLQRSDTDHIDADTIDTLMRSQCDMLPSKDG